MSGEWGKCYEIVKSKTQPIVELRRDDVAAVKGTVRNKGSGRRKNFHTLCHTMFRSTSACDGTATLHVPTQLRYLNVAPRSAALGGTNERKFLSRVLVQALWEQLLPRVRKACWHTHTHTYTDTHNTITAQQNRVVTPWDVFDSLSDGSAQRSRSLPELEFALWNAAAA